MASQTSSYQCPACTGPLNFDGKTGKLVCEYCGSAYDVKQIEELYAGKNQQAAQAAASQSAGSAGEFTADEVASWGGDAAKMKAYSCTSCGAELICEKSVKRWLQKPFHHLKLSLSISLQYSFFSHSLNAC